jgi:hypothetical protein
MCELKFSQPDDGSIYIYYDFKFPIIDYGENRSEDYKLNLDDILNKSEYPEPKEYGIVDKMMKNKNINVYSIVGLVFKKIKGYEKYLKYFIIEYGVEKNKFFIPVTQESNDFFLNTLKEIKDNQNNVDEQMTVLDKDEDEDDNIIKKNGGKKRRIKRRTKRKPNKKRKTTKKR